MEDAKRLALPGDQETAQILAAAAQSGVLSAGDGRILVADGEQSAVIMVKTVLMR